MKSRLRKIFSDNSGLATIFAIIVATIVMVFCLSLLLVSYTLYTSSLKSQNRSKCRSMTVSLSGELEEMLTGVSFDSQSEEDSARLSGQDSLWFYLRDNLDDDKWQAYENGDSYTTHETADRVFNVDTDGITEGADVTVTMYWTCDTDYADDDTYDDDSSDDIADTGDINLYVMVESALGGQRYSLTSCYNLVCDEQYDDSTGYKWEWQYSGRGEPDDE